MVGATPLVYVDYSLPDFPEFGLCNRALRGLAGERVEALEKDGDEAIRIGPSAEILWRGAPVARLTPGDGTLSPQVEILPSELLDPPRRERVRRRLVAWVEAHVRATLAALFALRE